MQLTQDHIENLKAYYRTHAESAEQPASIRGAYTSAIARLDALKDPTVEQLEAFIDAELVSARKCAGKPTLTDTEKRHRPTEKAKKFRIGLPGISSDRWIEQPDLPPCCHGDNREWHIEDGTSYQSQLFCVLNKYNINPSGFTCEGCYQRKNKVAGMDKKDAGDWIVAQVEAGRMTQHEALQLVKEYALDVE